MVKTMTTTTKSLHANLRAQFMATVSKYLQEAGEEVLSTGSNEIAIPCVDAEGNEEFMVITFKVPTGSRDGEAYDGYLVAQDYADKVKEKEAKALEAKAKKEKKMAEQKALKESKAKQKEQRNKQ